MDINLSTNLKNIIAAGAISVEAVAEIQARDGYVIFVLLGPTGSGKSSFIEAIASNTTLSLSSNKLEGFTQRETIYGIANVNAGRLPIFIVDVPGFMDSKISAMGIVSMLKNMIQRTSSLYWFRILYLTPIHNPRLPGSQRQLLQTFDALTGVGAADCITVVSTMWDLVWSESAKRREESNLKQLRDDIWKGYIDEDARWPSFTILNKSISRPLQKTPFAPNIYQDLQIRIQDLRIEQANFQSDRQRAIAQSDEKLQASLVPLLDEVQLLLDKFEQELHDFESGPERTRGLVGSSSFISEDDSSPVPQIHIPITLVAIPFR
ncbi:hypothetical protein BJ165DRAFT_1511659 [Panaeolus papilionaceus]|nr:hypothetical protein BJ165DRAFT_1511659 [Panaeolus papilionaceus]